MHTDRYRFDLKLLCVITMIPAVYLGGWRQTHELTRVAVLSEAEAHRLRQEYRALEQVAESWRRIALDRHATDAAGGATSRRWKIAVGLLEKGSLARQLDQWGIQLATLMPGEMDFHVVSDLSGEMLITRCNEFPPGFELVECESLDPDLLTMAGLDQDPLVVFRVLPPELVEELLAAEASHLSTSGIHIKNVVETTFDLRPRSPSFVGSYIRIPMGSPTGSSVSIPMGSPAGSSVSISMGSSTGSPIGVDVKARQATLAE